MTIQQNSIGGLTMSFHRGCSTKHEFFPVEQVSDLVRRKTDCPPQQPCHYYIIALVLVMQVHIAACRVQPGEDR